MFFLCECIHNECLRYFLASAGLERGPYFLLIRLFLADRLSVNTNNLLSPVSLENWKQVFGNWSHCHRSFWRNWQTLLGLDFKSSFNLKTAINWPLIGPNDYRKLTRKLPEELNLNNQKLWNTFWKFETNYLTIWN